MVTKNIQNKETLFAFGIDIIPKSSVSTVEIARKNSIGRIIIQEASEHVPRATTPDKISIKLTEEHVTKTFSLKIPSVFFDKNQCIRANTKIPKATNIPR